MADPVTAIGGPLADHDLVTGFAALFVGRFDAGSRPLTWVNAGQDAGLILRAATEQVETLPPMGSVLDRMAGTVYTEETVTLGCGDVLALYTDGLSEAGSTRADLLTGDGVADLLRGLARQTNPQAVVERLMAGVGAHAPAWALDDQYFCQRMQPENAARECSQRMQPEYVPLMTLLTGQAPKYPKDCGGAPCH